MRRLLNAIGLNRDTRGTESRVISHRYRLLESLGECGAGERFVAEDEAADEHVLLLLLAPTFSSPGIPERLRELDMSYGDARILRAAQARPASWSRKGRSCSRPAGGMPKTTREIPASA